MKKQAWAQLLLFVSVFAFAPWAMAVEDFVVFSDRLKVYAEPTLNSEVILVLSKGQKVKAGSHPALGFKKVLIKGKSGKNTIGYVALAELAPSKNPKKKMKKAGAPSLMGLHNHYSFGLTLGFDYQSQAGKALTDTNGDNATASRISGTNARVGALFDFPLRDRLNGEFFVDYKPTNNTATAAPGGTVTQTSDVILAQNFIAVGLLAKFYNDEASNWWYGPGFEWDHVGTSTLQVGANPSGTYSGGDQYQLFAATGYDFIGSKNFFIVPSFRLGASVNNSPLLLEFDMLISGLFRF